MQREILALLGLPGRSAPAGARHSPPPSAAPLFMLDLYRAMASQDEDDGPSWAPQRRALDGADTVMSFVNVGECRARWRRGCCALAVSSRRARRCTAAVRQLAWSGSSRWLRRPRIRTAALPVGLLFCPSLLRLAPWDGECVSLPIPAARAEPGRCAVERVERRIRAKPEWCWNPVKLVPRLLKC
ncbi:UNVERIFIED_CONTAM: hypothetical protein K2H54_044125 [Gekko kuhli]